MWKLLVLVIAVNIIVITSCKHLDSDNDSGNTGDNEPVLDSECNGGVGRSKVSITAYAFRLLYNLIQSRNIVNNTIIGAPVLSWYVVAQHALYLYKKTSVTRVMRFLGLRNKDEARCVMLALNRIPNNQPENTHFLFSSNMWADEENKLTSRYRQDVVKYMEGRAFNVNFHRPETTIRHINRYTSNQINNTITNVAPSSRIINDRQSLVSVTGIFFQARWMYAFDKKNITQGDYHETTSNVIKVPFVYQEAEYNYTYSSKLRAKVVSIPFEGGFFQCFQILPDTPCGVRSIAQQLFTRPELWTEVINNLELTHVKLYLPYYSYGVSVVDNVDMLRRTGDVDPIFEDNPAQLNNVFKNKTPAHISGGVLSIRLNNILDGEMQANIDGSSKTNRLKQVEFTANRPTIIIIQRDGLPIYILIGKVRKQK